MGLLNQLRKHIGGEKQEEVRGESTERHVPNPGDETVGKCYSGSSLLRLFNLTAGIPRDSFGKICPSLVEQITHSCKPAETTHDQLDPEMYGWATLAVVTITALSMLAMVAVPTSGSRFYATVMQLFVSLAVSSLSGDALLHLLPEALGIHGLPKEEGEPNQILVILTVVIAIYFFFVFERVMSLCLRGKPLGHGHVHSRPRRETFVGEDEFEVRSAVHQVAVYDEVKLKDKSEEDRNEVKQKIGELNGDQIQTADDSEQAPKKTIFGLNTLVVMVLVGDIVHNITDGVTIGVSFVNGPFAGVSTAIAVFFHEVPHEIGDFAVMLRSGVSFKKAMFLSLISNLIGFVGLYAGLFLGSENVMQRWIYAATAGMFLYIALVSLIPEMNQQAEEASGSPWMVFMRHNVGLLTGWFIMLFIGFFEQYKDQGKI
ncbi:zinc transporter ZIP12-like isoform X1 [Asterias amurensis]|uniref:zinc transporter ZIP12-like isoform X1 n=2 Tax=Asterias amurensis TaxID=7602 RepID=UPI003AB1FCC5